MEKFDFLTKRLVNTFTYTTITKDRYTEAPVNIDGRLYIKCGICQAVTFVGNLYEDSNNNHILMIGIAKQHPCDSKCDKNIAYEVAQMRSMFSPDIIMNSVPEYINSVNFSHMVEWYIDGMNLDFMKTKTEIEKSGDNPKKYNR